MTDREPIWDELEREPPSSVTIDGRKIARGSRVRIAPHGRGDLLDSVLAGKVGRVEGIDQDHDGNVHLAVVIEEDPGRDLGAGRYPAHRFFFSAAEVEPVDDAGAASRRRLLVAGIGNLFLGDDGFGVEVARRLAERALPDGVEVVDFGIRGMDLVYALGDGWDGVILVDALRLGEAAGTLAVVEPDPPDEATSPFDGHAMDPFAVLGTARRLGTIPDRTLVVGCEPGRVPDVDGGEEMLMELSTPVEAAVSAAVERVAELAAEFVEHGRFVAGPRNGRA